MNKKKVIVGLSGGVDSAVSAVMLKEAGYDVTGVTMAIYDAKAGTSKTHSHKNACYDCDEEKDVEAARELCKKIDIPFHVFDCIDEYKKVVLAYFKETYLRGATPNPCVRCNHLMKFGAIPALAKQSNIEFDYFATGHYAQIDKSNNGRFFLKKAHDSKKDQTYFLYRLSQESLAQTLFPLGGMTKAQTRELAAKYGLEIHDKPDSQDFYSGDYNDILQMPPRKGNITFKDGTILGEHEGFWNYTIGQRKGLNVSYSEPLYVIDVNAHKNEVTVGTEADTFSSECDLSDWFSPLSVEELNGKKLSAKIRSSQTNPEEAIVSEADGKIKVSFTNPQKAITKGQSLVLYDNDILIGGGTIA